MKKRNGYQAPNPLFGAAFPNEKAVNTALKLVIKLKEIQETTRSK